jgi:pantoate kinase
MEEATAFVPGHITGFFSPQPHEDPDRAGSRGGGVTLSHGVATTVSSGAGVVVNGNSLAVEPVERVLDALGVAARVAVETPLPLGAGFGVSGAMALGTALAATAATSGARTENQCTAIAHRAEVAAGTGLGDVVAQARGGVPLRLDPGAPGYGRMDGIPGRSRVEYLTLGELSTEDVLASDTEALSQAGDRAFARVRETPTLPTFLEASRTFAESVDLLTADLQTVLAKVDEVGETASMAMLGETAFCLGTGLSDAGYDPAVCQVHPSGAELTD